MNCRDWRPRQSVRNKLNQLISVEADNGMTASYEYDAMGRRDTKTVNGEQRQFYYDGFNIISEVIPDTTGLGFDVIKQYHRGKNLIASSIAGVVSRYGYDPHGNVVAIRGTEVYSYDAFGNQIADNPAYANPFRYCGEYFDEETGLIYLRARYYDSSIGRFISEDPIKDGVNWYVYCGNDPINFWDPSGYLREAGYVDGVWCEDPDAYEFGKDSDTYKILVDLGNRRQSGTDEQKAEYNILAEYVRTLARDNTPIQYAQDKIMDQLHKNAKIALDYQATMTTGLSGVMYQLGGGNYLTDSAAFLIEKAYGDWNYKYDANWQVPYDYFGEIDMNVDNNRNWRAWMYFDGMLISADKFGNINMAYVGTKMGLPHIVFQNFATKDKDDTPWVQYGIDMAEQGR